jgi:hypothetical protein
MWRKMNNKAFYAYNCAINSNGDESHPFINNNGGNGQLRTNISAARQFNESPSFQRLVTTALTESNNNSTSIQQQNINAMNTLARNRYNTINNRSNLSSHINSNNINNNNNNNLNMNRVDECMLNTDPYLTYKGAQTLSRQGNYSQSNYYSNYGNYGGASTTTNAVK